MRFYMFPGRSNRAKIHFKTSDGMSDLFYSFGGLPLKLKSPKMWLAEEFKPRRPKVLDVINSRNAKSEGPVRCWNSQYIILTEIDHLALVF